jgi:hypothetical protein
MSRGERGGTVTSLADAEKLHEQYRFQWRQRIKWRIVKCLVETGRFHASDLLDLDVPDDCKNVIGSSIGAAVRKGLMLETGERRASADMAGHGRKSAVYEVNPAGRAALVERWDRHREQQPAPVPERLFEPEPKARPGHFEDAA